MAKQPDIANMPAEIKKKGTNNMTDNPLLPGFTEDAIATEAESAEDQPDTLAVDIDAITAPTIHVRKQSPTTKYKRLIRGENARQAVRQFEKDVELFGFTKGQFSLIDLISATLEKTGPAKISVCTWTANNTDLAEIHRLQKKGMATSARFLLDFSTHTRRPGLVAAIRECFGDHALRVTRIHAKFITIRNAEWDVSIRTSMNLNMNPRFEDFTLTNDPDLADFLEILVDDLFSQRATATADKSMATFAL